MAITRTSRKAVKQDRSSALISTTGIVLSDEQAEVVQYLRSGSGNVFLTGAAGSGKSVALAVYLEENPNAVVLAPTGIAALLVGGSTIHSHFGLNPDLLLHGKGRIAQKLGGWARDRLRYARILIIDEVSMVRCDLMDAMDECLRYVKGNDQPFGGVRMIFVGDPYQLPPVVTSDEKDALKERYGRSEGWFFHSEVWQLDRPKKFVLKECHRQKGDDTFIKLLNRMREGDTSVADDINSMVRVTNAPLEDVPALCSTNAAANRRNLKELQQLDEDTMAFSQAEIGGNFPKNLWPVDDEFEMRIGARVMTVINNLEEGYVNGSLGYIVDYDEFTGYPIVEFDLGAKASIEPYTWERKALEGKELKVLGFFEQIPLRHAWAITIHKSQGQSFDESWIDLGNRAFAAGQAYVAFSRVRSLAGVTMSRELTKRDVFIDPLVKEFLTEMQNTA